MYITVMQTPCFNLWLVNQQQWELCCVSVYLVSKDKLAYSYVASYFIFERSDGVYTYRTERQKNFLCDLQFLPQMMHLLFIFNNLIDYFIRLQFPVSVLCPRMSSSYIILGLFCDLLFSKLCWLMQKWRRKSLMYVYVQRDYIPESS